MGRKKVIDKKLPAEYPQFAFRIGAKDKERILDLLQGAQTRLNREKRDDEPFYNRNDIIVRILTSGLQAVRNKGYSGF